MTQIFRALLIASVASLASYAHFVFVVPDANGASAKLIISETLEPDEAVGARLLTATKLHLRDTQGKDSALQAEPGGSFHTLKLPGDGSRVIHGVADMGVMQLGRAPKPFLLTYYPKSMIGNAFSGKAVGEAPVELVPTGKPGAVKFQLLAKGKPLANSEITVIMPDGTQKKVKTDDSGVTEAFSQTGRYGAWARFFEPGSGEKEGKKYEELRHYATLVFDANAANTPSKFATLPEATSSFGSVVSDGWLYVYGGHISPTHNYSTAAVSGKFNRVKLTNPNNWEELPAGPAMQGMNLTAHKGMIYRIGGMSPLNKPGDPADNHSTADCARFNPKTKKWDPLPSLPEPRSSHDVIVLGNLLIVSGGWALNGPNQSWPATFETLDLSAKKLEWKSALQPFKRRALMAAAHNGKMYVIGGFDDQNRIVRDVTIYDPKTGQWSDGAKLPAGKGLAFAPAAGEHDGKLYVSLSDGTLYRLNESTTEWEVVGRGTPRVAHRIASYQGGVLVLGGADKGKNLDLVESFGTR